MKAIVSFGWNDVFCFDVSAVPFLSGAFKVKEVSGAYHPATDFEGVEIKLVPDEKIRLTEESQQQDYKGTAEMYTRFFNEEAKKTKELKKQVADLTAAMEALKGLCPHTEAPAESTEKPAPETEHPF